MGVVWRRVRSESRRGWSSMLFVALLIGLGGGATLLAVAGARRTDTAMGRFLAFDRPEDLFAIVDSREVASALLALPEVESATRTPYMFLSPSPSGADLGVLNPFAAADRAALRTIDRPIILAGRLARASDPAEAVVNETAAKNRHLEIGGHVRLYAYSNAQLSTSVVEGFDRLGRPEGPVFDVRVVGIGRWPEDVNAPAPRTGGQDVIYLGDQNLLLTPGFLEHYARAMGVPPDDLPGMEGIRIRLRDRRELPAFLATTQARFGDHVELHPGSDSAAAAAHTQRGIHLQAVILLAAGVLTAAATALVVGQSLVRHTMLTATDSSTLWGLGMTPRQIRLVGAVRGAVIGAVGGLIAVAVAIACSPLTPIGPARQAEIHPGIAVHTAALSIGWVVITLLTTAGAAWAAGRRRSVRVGSTRRSPSAGTASRLGSLAARAHLPPSAVTGLTMRREGRSGLAGAIALVATSTAIAGLAASLVAHQSLDYLVRSPRQQGWTWDVLVGNPNTQEDLRPKAAPILEQNPYVDGYTAIATADGMLIGGKPVAGAAIERLRGAVGPLILQGRAPRKPDELMVGTRTLHSIGKHVGDTVTVERGARRADMQIVGRFLVPSAGDVFTGRLDEGVALTLDGYRRLQPDAMVSLIAVSYKPGASPAAAFASLRQEFGRIVLTHLPASDVEDLRQLRALPYALAGLLAVLGLAAFAHTLTTTVRRRRTDLAVLKTIGFRRGQVAAVIAWQGLYLVALAVLVGIPLGVLAGVRGWRVIASRIGAVSPSAVPPVSLALIVPAAIVAALVLSALPAWWATRVRPAVALRSG